MTFGSVENNEKRKLVFYSKFLMVSDYGFAAFILKFHKGDKA